MGDGNENILRLYASILGASGVGAGAFGAHYLKETLMKKPNGMDNWRTAVMYHLIHATAILAASNDPSCTKGGKIMSYGTLMFSGSIYCLCLDFGPKKLFGPMTPIGGFFLIGGWIMMGMGYSSKSHPSSDKGL